jgi:hypothetical protein
MYKGLIQKSKSLEVDFLDPSAILETFFLDNAFKK